ncbi:family 43 glycosylhydrolase, partial [Mycobacterium tuberculosis]|nr:family 43 glycosylhydrolase [Mycobacterium tuberculosis]
RAVTREGLRDAEPVVVWRAPQSGPMSQLIWAPELHEIDGKWYIYFAATHTHDLDALGMFQHRMFVLECADSDPLTGRWQEKGQVVT